MQKIVAKQALTQNGWEANVEIGMEAGRIVHVQPAPEGAASTVGLALPATLNLHSHAFQRAMSGLTERERLIVRERKLREPARTLESLGQELSLSKERVRQLEAAAFQKMRRALEGQSREVLHFL